MFAQFQVLTTPHRERAVASTSLLPNSHIRLPITVYPGNFPKLVPIKNLDAFSLSYVDQWPRTPAVGTVP